MYTEKIFKRLMVEYPNLDLVSLTDYNGLPITFLSKKNLKVDEVNTTLIVLASTLRSLLDKLKISIEEYLIVRTATGKYLLYFPLYGEHLCLIVADEGITIDELLKIRKKCVNQFAKKL